MKIISWNIRGCNSPLKTRILKRKIEVEQPWIILLQETKCSGEVLEKIARKAWPSCKRMALDASGSAGGLGILWNPNLVSLHGFRSTCFSLSGFFQIIGASQVGFLSNVYGPSQSSRKLEFLDSLPGLKEEAGGLPWILGGDFNIIRSLEEKKGGIRRLTQVNELFHQAIEELRLVDLRTANSTFTWYNNRTGDRSIACRLDRFLVSEDIIMGGGQLSAVVLPSAGSDHWPISLEWTIQTRNPCRPIRFEKF